MENDSTFYDVTVRSGGYVLADLCAHPFLTVWTSQQAKFFEKKISVFNVIYETYKQKRFFDGFSMQAISAVPGTFLYLKGRELSLTLLGDNYFGQTMQGPMGVGLGMLLWSPTSRLTMLQQASNKKDFLNSFNQLSLLGKSKSIWKKEGVRGFYRGTLGLTCSFSVTDALGSLLQAQILKCYPENDRQHACPQILSTSIDFTLAAFATSPIEIAVCHLKIQESNPEKLLSKTLPEAAKAIYLLRGVRGFFHATPALVAHSVTWHMILPFTTLCPTQGAH